MYRPVKKSVFVLVALTLLAVDHSMAMSLGRHRGPALVGRPLDISVQAVLDAQDDPAALCTEVDVFYADNKLDKSLVRVNIEKALSNPLDTTIRIRSSVPVDEPVVTLSVQVGCQQKTERRYVVLADLASEPINLPASPTVARPSAKQLTPSVTAGNTPAVSAAAAAALSSTVSAAVTAPVTAASARRSAVQPMAVQPTESNNASELVVADLPGNATFPKRGAPMVKRDLQRVREAGAASTSRAGKARLMLEPVDFTAERNPQLKASTELLSVPVAGEQQRSAAAALWRAITAQPQDILRDAEKLQALETSLSTLRSEAKKNQLVLTELNSQLEKTRTDRYANGLIYVLFTLLLLALAAGIYVWRQRALLARPAANDLPWWRKNKLREPGWGAALPVSGTPVAPGQFEAAEKNAKKEEKSAFLLPDMHQDLGPDESAFTDVEHLSGMDTGDSVRPASSSLDFVVSMPHVARSVKAEELFDIQQQADFFVSLGQHEQAVAVLCSHLQENAQTSPLVYMDLFNLYHLLERKADYEALRKDFNRLFTGNIPAFELYTASSAGLDAYPVALTRIEALWPSPKVLNIIEESIFRKPVANADAFDLEAYRELLLLHAVAKEIVQPDGRTARTAPRLDLPDLPFSSDAATDGSNVQTPRFSPTSIQPLPAVTVESGLQNLDELLPLPLLQVELDLDLNRPVGSSDTPPVAAQPNLNSNFFARLGTKNPGISLVPPPTTGALYVPLAAVDNMIDFDEFEPSIKNVDQVDPPKG